MIYVDRFGEIETVTHIAIYISTYKTRICYFDLLFILSLFLISFLVMLLAIFPTPDFMDVTIRSFFVVSFLSDSASRPSLDCSSHDHRKEDLLSILAIEPNR